MSAKPVPRPVKKPRPAGAAPRPSHAGKTGLSDLVAIAAGVVLLIVVGYVGYRTQVKGESLEAVLPFLAPQKAGPAGTPPALATTTPSDKPVGTDFVGDDSPFADPSKKKAPATTLGKQEALPTGAEGLFGRRYDPTEPKEHEVEYGEQTASGRKIIKTEPGPKQ